MTFYRWKGHPPHNRLVPRQLFFPCNHPLLFVIPTAGEGSAVHPSVDPDLPFVATLFFVILPAPASRGSGAPHRFVASQSA